MMKSFCHSEGRFIEHKDFAAENIQAKFFISVLFLTLSTAEN